MDMAIRDFEESFMKRFHIKPTVSYVGYIPIPVLTFEELEEAGNVVLEELKLPEREYPLGVRTIK